jgi:hypothetical protein
MGDTPVTSVLGAQARNRFGDVDRPVYIGVDGVSTLFAFKEFRLTFSR